MWEARFVVGSAGNVSRRAGADHIAITPTSLAYDLMTSDDVTIVEITTGKAVGENVVKAPGDRTGVILANHGNVCVGRDLTQALHVAVVMESAARAYVQALSIGEPISLPDDAIAAGRRLFDSRKR